MSIVVDIVHVDLWLLLSIVYINNHMMYMLVTNIWLWCSRTVWCCCDYCCRCCSCCVCVNCGSWLLCMVAKQDWCSRIFLLFLLLEQDWWSRIFLLFLVVVFCCIVAQSVIVLSKRIITIEIVDLVSFLFKIINYLLSK